MRVRHLRNALLVGVLLTASVGIVNVEAAIAQPPQVDALNSSAVFALNLPGGVVADAVPAGASGASIASVQTFDWAYAAPTFAPVSGTFTATPALPATALTAAEEAAFWQIVNNFKGAPATRMASLVKPAAGVAGLAIESFFLGTAVGHGWVELNGIDADGVVCSSSMGAGQVALNLLSATECSGYNQLVEEFQANTDVGPDVNGGTSCSAAGACLTFIVEERLQYTTPFGYGTPSQWHSDRFWCMNQTNTGTGYVSYLTTSRSLGSTSTNVWPTTNKPIKTLAICSGNRWVNFNATSTSAPYPAFKDLPVAWVYNPSGTTTQVRACLEGTGSCYGATVAVPEITVEDIERTLVCRIVGSDELTYTATSDTFTEGSGTLPPIVCPQLPVGVTVASLTITEEGGETSLELLQEDATDAYVDWWETYEECVNGSCLLDLRQNGSSCFEQGVDCDGWFSDPNRDTTYTCRYGTHAIALSGCYVYATTFSPTHQESGTAYADPITGGSVQTPTSPTEVDRLTQHLLERGWLTHGPTPGGFVYGNAAENPDPYAAARAVAVACVALELVDSCLLPIFAPGDNVKEAAIHDLEAIQQYPTWALLTRADPKQVADGWYVGKEPCGDPPYSPLQCDEYPFKSTWQAGYLSGTRASLKLIDAVDNVQEGTYLNIFYTACSIEDGDQFLVIPIPSAGGTESRSGPPTAAWC